MMRSGLSFRHRSLGAAVIAALVCACDDAEAPPGMCWIPTGEFTMGTDDPESMANERPAHRVRVTGFWMDATPVTNARFAAFVAATGYVTTAERPIDWEDMQKQVPPGTPKPPPEDLLPGALVFTPPPPEATVDLRQLDQWWSWVPGASWRHPEGPGSTIEGKDDYPVVQVSWEDAVAYAQWADKRLPTEAEWEYAARGGLAGKRFAWGDEFAPDGRYRCNTFTGTFPVANDGADGFTGTNPVRAYPPNGYGLHDMAGNVWQWTADLYRPDTHAIAAAESGGCCIDPKGPRDSFDATRPVPTATEYVIKGGSFLCNPNYCASYRPNARRGMPPDTGTSHVGFRCVRDAGSD